VQTQAQQDLDRFTDDMAYFYEHRRELRDRFRDQWVALHNHEVVGAARELERLIEQLERKGIDPGHTYREYLTEDKDLLILMTRRT
jgi:hypothetical protein